jgi:hypothetical protein
VKKYLPRSDERVRTCLCSLPSYSTHRLSKRRVLQNYLLVWVDASINETHKDCQHTLTQLRTVVNDVTVFTDPDACADFLGGVTDEKAFVMVSGSLGQPLVPRIHSMTQVDSIYIF